MMAPHNRKYSNLDYKRGKLGKKKSTFDIIAGAWLIIYIINTYSP